MNNDSPILTVNHNQQNLHMLTAFLAKEHYTARIPFIIISPKQSATIQQTGLGHGASNVPIKPLFIKELLAVIHSLLGG